MCTAVVSDGFFGRTLDVERSYGEKVVRVEGDAELRFLHEATVKEHPRMIGMGIGGREMPLFFDAMNDAGLCAAALNFCKNAVYHEPKSGAHNVASFEFIPWILANCKTIDEAFLLLGETNITNESISKELKATPLHWMIADKERCLAVESVSTGLEIYENDLGVLTNDPPFFYHLNHISNFLNLNSNVPNNTLCPSVAIKPYSRGLGAFGLPGDYSSSSRFVRAVFAREHTKSLENTIDSRKNRFFHIMNSVSVPYGCVKTETGEDSYTVYTSCMDIENKCYNFTTYMCGKIQSYFF